MAEYTSPTPCDLADITAASNCGEDQPGIATTIYVGFKNDLETPYPRLKTPGAGGGTFELGDYSYVEGTPGFKFKSGKAFNKWEIKTDSGQFTFNSNGQKKGYTQQLVGGFDSMTPELSAMLRTLNNRPDAFFVWPEGEKYVCLYDPDRNITIDLGGIAYDSGTTPDSDTGVTFTISLNTRPPKTYYDGTIQLVPTP